MPGQNLLQFIGGGAQKPTRFVSLFTSRFLVGLYTNRSPLRGPMDSIFSDFYHMGATDALLGGLNSELSSRSTMIRRPGNPKYSTAPTAALIDSFYSFHESDGTIQLIADSATDVEVLTPTTNTSIFTKAAAAGQSYFQGVNKSLYIGDGVDLVKYIPGTTNPNTSQPIWNWGGVAPTTAPTLVVTQSGATAVPWAAATWFSTMGVIIDANGNAQLLQSVNADGTNPGSQFGLSGSGAPNWSAVAIGGTVVDGTVTWTNNGPVSAWKPITGYNGITVGGTALQPAVIYDANSKGFYENSRSTAGTASGSTKPPFTGTVFSDQHFDNFCNWVCFANSSTTPQVFKWRKNFAYGNFLTSFGPDNCIIEPFVPPFGAGQTSYIFTASGNGTSQATAYTPVFGTSAGAPTLDGQLRWICLGSATRQNVTAYTAWYSPNNTSFNVVKDPDGNMHVCVQAGVSAASAQWHSWQASTTYALAVNIIDTNGNVQVSTTAGTSKVAPHPVWNTTIGGTTADNTVVWTNKGPAYGFHTTDGSVIWVCVGPAVNATWTASQSYYLPSAGFSAPSSFDPYGGADIIDTNSNIQFVVKTGVSAGAHPAWNVTTGGYTTDNAQITWFNNGPFGINSRTWTSGFGICYAFKARKATDAYVTAAPPLWATPLGAPTGCGDGGVTTASPVTQIVGGNTGGATVTISAPGSADPQFDTVEIYRSADGFGTAGPYLFLTDIPMPTITAGNPGTWTLVDYMPDLATSTLPGLNPLIVAPIDHVNDPPPGQYGSLQFLASSSTTPTIAAAGSGLQGVVYHQGRLWGFIGTTVFASGGPDTNPGNGFTAWPPDQTFPFDSVVVRLLSTTAGLFVFTTTDVGFIGGGPAITAYEPQVIFPGVGILSWNAVTTIAGVPYIFTSDRQILGLDPGGGIKRIGHNIGDKLSSFNPANVYLTYHSFGDLDNALFISDGSSQWYRCDPNMAPDGKYTGPVWSPRATIAGGFTAMQSIETAPGVRKLLVGPSGAGYVLARDSTFTNFLDNGSPYASNFIMGCIVLAHPGQIAEVDFVEMDFQQTGTQPGVSILFDELSPTNQVPFELISSSFVSDPPKMYGPTGTPSTIWMNRYYFSGTRPGNAVPVPGWCKFLQLKVDFGNTDSVQNELLAFSVFGSLWQEK